MCYCKGFIGCVDVKVSHGKMFDIDTFKKKSYFVGFRKSEDLCI